MFEEQGFEPEDDLRTIRALIITDNDGKRIASRHFSLDYIEDSRGISGRLRRGSGPQEQRAAFEAEKGKRQLEKTLWRLAKGGKEEIVLIDGSVCLISSYGDVRFFVVGNPGANELLLGDALTCFLDMFRLLFGELICKDMIMDNLHAAFLLLDEMCHEGILLETDPKLILDRLREGAAKGFEELTVSELLQIGQKRIQELMETSKSSRHH